MKIRLNTFLSFTRGCATLLSETHNPFENPFPSLSVAPKISNMSD